MDGAAARNVGPGMRECAGLLLAVALTAASVLGCGTDCRNPEAVLRANLRTMREAVAQYKVDKGVYPARLEELVGEGYLRTMPLNPLARSGKGWEEVVDVIAGRRQVVGVRSAVGGRASDGSRYESW